MPLGGVSAGRLPLFPCGLCRFIHLPSYGEADALHSGAGFFFMRLTMHLREERMSQAMVKWHLEGAPFAAVLHQFTEPDHGHPHSHPWPFQSTVLKGGYIEQAFQLDGSFEYIERRPGESFHIPAQHIHRIVELPHGECWTMIVPGEHVQTSGFYDFREDGTYHRFWNDPEFRRIDG